MASGVSEIRVSVGPGARTSVAVRKQGDLAIAGAPRSAAADNAEIAPMVRLFSPAAILGLAARFAALPAIALGLALAVGAMGPIAQDQHFHDFADTSLFGLAHFGNVVSNAAYLVVGLVGLRRIAQLGAALPTATALALRAWFTGFVLVAAGSAWYHADPGDTSLVWDRAAMTVVFAAASAIYVADRISGRAGLVVLAVLVALGLWSQAYWYATDDLRPYRFAELLPFALVPAITVLFPGRLTTFRHALAVIAVFAAATVCEHFDAEIADLLGDATSGHTIKHLISAGAGWLMVPMVARRALSIRFPVRP
jgi:hypothetical protein